MQQQGVAIVCCTRDLGGSLRTAGTADVLDDDRLPAQGLAQCLGKITCDLVSRAPGRERHDDGDRLFRLFGAGGGEGGQRGGDQGGEDK